MRSVGNCNGTTLEGEAVTRSYICIGACLFEPFIVNGFQSYVYVRNVNGIYYTNVNASWSLLLEKRKHRALSR